MVKAYRGSERRARLGNLRAGTQGEQESILIEAGFESVETLVIPGELSVDRSVDDLVAWVYSRSNSVPHLFGGRLTKFETKLGEFLEKASPEVPFQEALPDTVVEMYRPV